MKGERIMNGYSITRDKFLSVNEVKKLLRVCQRNALTDLEKKLLGLCSGEVIISVESTKRP